MIRGNVPNQMMPRAPPQSGELWEKSMYLSMAFFLTESLLYYKVILATLILASCHQKSESLLELEPREEENVKSRLAGRSVGKDIIRWLSIHLKPPGQNEIDVKINSALLRLLWMKQIHSPLKAGSCIYPGKMM